MGQSLKFRKRVLKGDCSSSWVLLLANLSAEMPNYGNRSNYVFIEHFFWSLRSACVTLELVKRRRKTNQDSLL